MIEKIRLKFGSSQSNPKLEIDVKPLTIFVGPNNSGKSLVLRDIVSFCQNGAIQGPILDDLVLMPVRDIEKEIKKQPLKPLPNEIINEGNTVIFGKRGARNHLPLETLKSLFSNPNANIQQFSQVFLAFNVIPLDGANRLLMINPEGQGDLKIQQPNFLFYLQTKVREARLEELFLMLLLNTLH
jgi:hypothetical protein